MLELSPEEQAAYERGREEVAEMFPLVHAQGVQEGIDKARNSLAFRLRSRARENPSLRTVLSDLLNGRLF